MAVKKFQADKLTQRRESSTLIERLQLFHLTRHQADMQVTVMLFFSIFAGRAIKEVLNGVRLAVFRATGSKVFVLRKHTLLLSFLSHKAKKQTGTTYILRISSGSILPLKRILIIPAKNRNSTLAPSPGATRVLLLDNFSDKMTVRMELLRLYRLLLNHRVL